MILVRPVITEKATKMSEKSGVYSFIVAKDSNKIQIRQAVEKMYNVTVADVNTMIMPAKAKSRSTKTSVVRGRKSSYKKAYVKLAPGETIDIFGAEDEAAA